MASARSNVMAIPIHSSQSSTGYTQCCRSAGSRSSRLGQRRVLAFRPLPCWRSALRRREALRTFPAVARSSAAMISRSASLSVELGLRPRSRRRSAVTFLAKVPNCRDGSRSVIIRPPSSRRRIIFSPVSVVSRRGRGRHCLPARLRSCHGHRVAQVGPAIQPSRGTGSPESAN